MRFTFINHWICSGRDKETDYIEFKMFDFIWYSDKEYKYCEMEIILFNFEFYFRIKG
jgi:hypothetical protein